MPIYEYRCLDCQAREEHLQKFSDVPLAQCPKCGGMHYQKQLSAAGFQLKGSGWYVSDFKGSSTLPVETTPAEAPSSETVSSGDSGGGGS